MTEEAFDLEILEVENTDKKGGFIEPLIKGVLIFLKSKYKKRPALKAEIDFIWDFLKFLKESFIAVVNLFKLLISGVLMVKNNFLFISITLTFDVLIYHIFKQLIILYNAQF